MCSGGVASDAHALLCRHAPPEIAKRADLQPQTEAEMEARVRQLEARGVHLFDPVGALIR